MFTIKTKSGEMPSVPVSITSRKPKDSQETCWKLTPAYPMLYLHRKLDPGLRPVCSFYSHAPVQLGKVVGVHGCFLLLFPGTILLLVVPVSMRYVSLTLGRPRS